LAQGTPLDCLNTQELLATCHSVAFEPYPQFPEPRFRKCSVVTLGRFELPTCGLGNRIGSLCIGMHGYAVG
jgi:hypothetical protein